MTLVLIAIILVTCITNTLLIILRPKNDSKSELKSTSELPPVSILVAARNEEGNIERCVNSLLQQNYPSELIEVLIGDDGSQDSTQNIARRLLADVPHAKVIKIVESQHQHLRGKANVLAQLANIATGQHLLITDADMKLPKTWVTGMVSSVEHFSALITGVTISESNDLQSLDWLFAMGMVKVLDSLERPVTTMGNNMLITKEAYQKIGGYENIAFSVTEDLALFNAAQKHGINCSQLYNPSILGITRPVSGYLNLLQQRKRWMKGAVTLHWSIVSLLIIQALYFPALLALLFIKPIYAVALFILKLTLQTTFLYQCSRRVGYRVSIIKMLLYEFHSWAVSLGSIVFYILPLKIKWKGRTY